MNFEEKNLNSKMTKQFQNIPLPNAIFQKWNVHGQNIRTTAKLEDYFGVKYAKKLNSSIDDIRLA